MIVWNFGECLNILKCLSIIRDKRYKKNVSHIPASRKDAWYISCVFVTIYNFLPLRFEGISQNIFLLLLGNKKQCLLFWPIPPFHCQILVWLTFVADTDIYHRHCLSQYFFIRSALFLSSMRAVPHNRKQHPGRSRQTCQNTMDLKWIFLFFWDLQQSPKEVLSCHRHPVPWCVWCFWCCLHLHRADSHNTRNLLLLPAVHVFLKNLCMLFSLSHASSAPPAPAGRSDCRCRSRFLRCWWQRKRSRSGKWGFVFPPDPLGGTRTWGSGRCCRGRWIKSWFFSYFQYFRAFQAFLPFFIFHFFWHILAYLCIFLSSILVKTLVNFKSVPKANLPLEIDR